jgi:hypothetical protein
MLTAAAPHVDVPGKFDSVRAPNMRVQVKGLCVPPPITTLPSPLTALAKVLSPSNVKVCMLQLPVMHRPRLLPHAMKSVAFDVVQRPVVVLQLAV